VAQTASGMLAAKLPNLRLKLPRPGFGPGLKPLGQMRERRAARRPTCSCAAFSGANGAGRAPRGFGTWALAAQLKHRSVRRSQTSSRVRYERRANVG
jgi:hypothetical protein